MSCNPVTWGPQLRVSEHVVGDCPAAHAPMFVCMVSRSVIAWYLEVSFNEDTSFAGGAQTLF